MTSKARPLEPSLEVVEDWLSKLCPSSSLSSVTTQPQQLRNVKLFPYQLEGLAFLWRNYQRGVGSLLGDEMGLGKLCYDKLLHMCHWRSTSSLACISGKTLQVLSLVAKLLEVSQSKKTKLGPILVVCPLSVIDQW